MFRKVHFHATEIYFYYSTKCKISTSADHDRSVPLQNVLNEQFDQGLCSHLSIPILILGSFRLIANDIDDGPL